MTSTPSAEIRRIAIELAALSASALAYCTDRFDIDRFHRIGELSTALMQVLAADPLPSYDADVAAVAGYATPKIDVRGGVFNASGQVLLVREILDEHRWTLPGGWCDVLDSPRGAVEREIREEAGLEARVTSLAAVIDRDQWPHSPPLDSHVYKLFFVCEPLGDIDLSYVSTETSEVGWFDVDDLPELSLSRVLPEQIALLHRHWQSPGAAHVD